MINQKHTYRLYTEESLQLRTKQCKKQRRPRQPLTCSISRNQRWSMDFIPDQLSQSRRFRVLNVVDDYSRELVGQLTSFSIRGQQVARFLSQWVETQGKPSQIVCDHGSEFTSKALFFWSKESDVALKFIQLGKPTQNAFVESLNGTFRNECLNQHGFRSLEEARYETGQWRAHDNHVRPHSSLNYLSPVEYAKQAA